MISTRRSIQSLLKSDEKSPYPTFDAERTIGRKLLPTLPPGDHPVNFWRVDQPMRPAVGVNAPPAVLGKVGNIHTPAGRTSFQLWNPEGPAPDPPGKLLHHSSMEQRRRPPEW